MKPFRKIRALRKLQLSNKQVPDFIKYLELSFLD